MKRRRRGLGLFLALSLILSLVEPLPAGAAEASYTPDVAGAYLLPAQAANDSSFIRTNVLTANGLHVDGHFTELTTEQNAVSVSGGDKTVLNPASTYMHSENRKWWTTYQWADMGETMKALLSSMQITATVSASLTADRHMHIGSHNDLTDRAQAYLYAGYNTSPIVKVSNSSNDPDGVARTYTSSGVLTSGGSNLRFRMGATDCSCGSSKVSKVYIYLSDTTAPTLTGIYLSDEMGEKISRTAYKGGQTLYLTMEMSEPIRFAGGVNQDLTLTLPLISTQTGQSTDRTVETQLASLKENKLIFSYTVPSGQNMDYTVVSVSPSQQAWMGGSYNLKLLDEKGAPLNVGSFTVNSQITDLAGNPLSWTASRELESRLYLDDVTPGYTRLNAAGNMTQGYQADTNGDWPEDITPSATWAGTGDYLAFTLTLNEEVGLCTAESYAQLNKESGVTAVLNVKDSDGTPIEVGLSSVSYAMDNVNDVRTSTILTFDFFRPADGMALDGSNPIRIVSLKAPDGSTLGDMAGNPLNTAVSLTPVEKLGLDVTAPTVTLLTENISVSADGPAQTITFPFTVTDEADGSGVDREQEVALDILADTAATVKYCITESPTPPASGDGLYKTLSAQQPTFPLPAGSSDTYYLHVYCADLSQRFEPANGQTSVEVSVTCRDYAGNQASASTSQSLQADWSEPVITLPDTFTLTGENTLSVPYSVSDGSHLKSVTVQWDSGSQEQVLEEGYASASYSGTTAYTATGESGTATLTVTAADAAGNTSTASRSYSYSLGAVTTRYTLGSDPNVITGHPSLMLYRPTARGGASGDEQMISVAVMRLENNVTHNELYSIFWLKSDENKGTVEPIRVGSYRQAAATSAAVGDGTVSFTGYTEGNTQVWTPSYEVYGTISMTLFTMSVPDWNAAVDAAVDGSFTVTPEALEAFDMKVATGSANNYMVWFRPPVDQYGNQVDTALEKKNGAAQAGVVQTLTGLRIPIQLNTNAGQPSDFRYDDIDYTASYAYLTVGTEELSGSRYYFTREEVIGNLLYYPITVPLYGQRLYVVPRLHLVCLDGSVRDATGITEENETYDPITLYMDDGPFLTDFYPNGYTQKYYSETVRSEGLTAETAQLTIGMTGSTGGTLTFQFGQCNPKAPTLLTYQPIEVWCEDNPDQVVTATYNLSDYTQRQVELKVADIPASPDSRTLYLHEGENTLHYRSPHVNGVTYVEKTLTVLVVNQTFSISAEVIPHEDGSVRVQLTADQYAQEQLLLNGRTVYAKFSNELRPVTLDSNLGFELFLTEMKENWAEEFYLRLYDSNWNIARTGDLLVGQAVDIMAPTIYHRDYVGSASPQGGYTLNATVAEPLGDAYNSGVDLGSFVLTFTYEDGTATTVPLPELSLNSTWSGNGSNYNGVYQITAEGTDNTSVALTINGMFPYGSAGSVTITMACQDNAGNTAAVSQYSKEWAVGAYSNTASAPTITVGAVKNGLIPITSDQPIRVLDPVPADTAGTFAEKHSLPIYTSSAAIQYEDAFGILYTQDIAASPFGENLTVSLSETAATRGPVTLTATATGGSTLTSVTSGKHGNAEISGSTATLELRENDTVTITMGTNTYTVQVTNIDNAVEPVTVAFYGPDGGLLDAGSGAESVTGPVTAALLCDELLVGQTSYVFPNGSSKGDSFTFSVSDQVGNTAQVTAALPWDVVNEEGTEPPADITAPTYQAGLYVQQSGIWQQVNSYDSLLTSGELSVGSIASDMLSLSGQGVRVVFSIQDDSPVNLIVKSSTDAVPGYDDPSDSIAGLSLSASTVTWTGGNASGPVYVYLVDAAGNAAAPLTLTFPGVDSDAPAATVEYAAGSEDGSLTKAPVYAYLVPGGEPVTVLDTGNLTLDENQDSTHYGQYYYTFTANGSYTFRFSDAAGNIGTVTATVRTINSDDTALELVSGPVWLCRGQTYTGNYSWQTAQQTLRSNTPVTATFTANLPLASAKITAHDADETIPAEGVDVTVSGNLIRVTYSVNCPIVSLYATAQNGQTFEYTSGSSGLLYAVTCLDMDAPTVTVTANGSPVNPVNGVYTVDGSGQRSVRLTFTTDEETASEQAACVEPDVRFGTEHTCTIYQNGTSSLTFTDQAGNVTTIQIAVTNLDDKLALSFSKTGSDSDAVTDPAELGQLTSGSTFYLKSTRNVTVSFGGAETQVDKSTWTSFTVPQSGSLAILKAKDTDGNTLYAYLSVALPDTVAPIISLPSQTVYAPAGAENLDLLREGVTVTDNRDSSLSFTVDTSGVTWDAAGSYMITYTAEDSAGNSSSVTRTLVLTAQSILTLRVNGQTVQPGSTLTLEKGTAEITLEGADAPVYLSLKQGYKTIAQMKLGSQVLLANASYTDPLETALTASGFHTLYLRAQDRTEYVFYLYVKG